MHIRLQALLTTLLLLLLAACAPGPSGQVPNFGLTFSGGGSGDGTVQIEQGDSLDVTVTVNGTGGFNGTVALEADVEISTALVPGITVTFDPASTKTTSTMTISIDSSVDFTDDYTVTVTGTSGSLTKTAELTVNVTEASTPGGSFDLTLSDPSVIVSPGASVDTTVTVSPVAGFSGDVTLGVTSPNGITGSFASNPVLGADGDSVLTLSAPGTLAPGDYTVTITGISGSVSDSVNITVTVDDGATLYVDPAGDDTTGDGSADDPFRTIGMALSVVAIDGTIVVRDGTYDTEVFPLTIGVDVTIRGESEAGTVIANPSATSDVILVNAGDLILGDLTIEGGADAIQVEGANDLNASDITVRDFADRGLFLTGVGLNTVTVERATFTAGTATSADIVELNNTGSTVSIGNTTIDGSASTNDSPEGIDVKQATAVTLNTVTITNVPDSGIEVDNTVSGASTFTMSNVTITGSGNVPTTNPLRRGIGLTISSDLATIDLGTNNAVSGSRGVEFLDERASGAVTVIDATGLSLNGTDVPDGSVTGPVTSGDRYQIVNDTSVDFGS